MPRSALHLTALALLLALALPGAVWVAGHLGHHDHSHAEHEAEPRARLAAVCQEVVAAWLHGHSHDSQVPEHEHAWGDGLPGTAREGQQRLEPPAPPSPLAQALAELEAESLDLPLEPEPPDDPAAGRAQRFAARSSVLRI
jgi:hypothetical protein